MSNFAGDGKGLQKGKWDTSRIDLVCDINAIPEPGAIFDAILYEHHLPQRGFQIEELTSNGDWFAYWHQELN